MTSRRVVPELVPLPGLKDARQRAGLTQLALAAASGVVTNTIHGLETGKQRRVAREAARRIAAALGTDLDALTRPR